MANRPKATESELLEISIQAREDQLEGLRAELRRVRRIERAADALIEAAGFDGYPETPEGLESFAEDLADELRSIGSEEAKFYAPEWLTSAAAVVS